jgi:hypothetical protein
MVHQMSVEGEGVNLNGVVMVHVKAGDALRFRSPVAIGLFRHGDTTLLAFGHYTAPESL